MTKNSAASPIQLTWSIVIGDLLAHVGILFRKYLGSSDLWHRHEEYFELIFVLSGSAVNDTENGQNQLQSGDLVVMSPGSVHHYIAINQFQHYVILLKPDILSLLPRVLDTLPNFHELFQSGKPCSTVLHIPERLLPDIVEKIERAQSEYLNRGPCWLEAFYAEFYCALVAMLRSAGNERRQCSPAAYQIGKAVHCMEENLQKEHTLKSLSVVSRMSVSNFRLRFREITGFSPIDYLIRLRLKHAAMQLVCTDLRVSEIIVQTGFSDSSYFTRQFRALFGRSPREFRKAVHAGKIVPPEELMRLFPAR